MEFELVAIIEGAATTVLACVVVALFRQFKGFASDQRKANELNRESIRSMQRAELLRMFQRCVEDGRPVTFEELEHVNACYAAYHANGGNGTGTWLWERINENAFVVTKAEKGESNEREG